MACSLNNATSQISDRWGRWHLLLLLYIPTATSTADSTWRPGKESIRIPLEGGGFHMGEVASMDGGFPGLVAHIRRELSHAPLELLLLQLQPASGYLLVLLLQQGLEPE